MLEPGESYYRVTYGNGASWTTIAKTADEAAADGLRYFSLPDSTSWEAETVDEGTMEVHLALKGAGLL